MLKHISATGLENPMLFGGRARLRMGLHGCVLDSVNSPGLAMISAGTWMLPISCIPAASRKPRPVPPRAPVRGRLQRQARQRCAGGRRRRDRRLSTAAAIAASAYSMLS